VLGAEPGGEHPGDQCGGELAVAGAVVDEHPTHMHSP
jgi:hypothetical protein